MTLCVLFVSPILLILSKGFYDKAIFLWFMYDDIKNIIPLIAHILLNKINNKLKKQDNPNSFWVNKGNVFVYQFQ